MKNNSLDMTTAGVAFLRRNLRNLICSSILEKSITLFDFLSLLCICSTTMQAKKRKLNIMCSYKLLIIGWPFYSSFGTVDEASTKAVDDSLQPLSLLQAHTDHGLQVGDPGQRLLQLAVVADESLDAAAFQQLFRLALGT